VSDDHENLLFRTKDPTDKAIPSGNGVTARTLLRLGALTGDVRYQDAATATFTAFLGLLQQAPRTSESLILGLAMYFDETASMAAPASDAGQHNGGDKADARVREAPVTAELFVSRLAAAPGESFPAVARLTIDKGWHINSHMPLQEYLKPTAVTLDDCPVISMGEIIYPDGQKVTLPFNAEPLSVYEDSVCIRIPLRVKENAAAGPARLAFRIRVQPCNERSCSAPKTLVLPVVIEIGANAEHGGMRHRELLRSLGEQMD
jgi:DsbC/DsbD-like thiol-disulfide interchange protein